MESRARRQHQDCACNLPRDHWLVARSSFSEGGAQLQRATTSGTSWATAKDARRHSCLSAMLVRPLHLSSVPRSSVLSFLFPFLSHINHTCTTNNRQKSSCLRFACRTLYRQYTTFHSSTIASVDFSAGTPGLGHAPSAQPGGKAEHSTRDVSAVDAASTSAER